MPKKSQMIAAGVLAAAISLGVTAPAFADDEFDDDSSSNDLQAPCSSGWKYFPGEVVTDGFLPVGGLQANYNGTAAPALVTFTSTASATVGVQVDGSTEVGVSAKLASANASLGTTLQASVTAQIGSTIQITVPPGQYGYGDFGIWSNYVSGEEQYWQGIGIVCNVTQRHSAGVQAPYRVGWNTWTG